MKLTVLLLIGITIAAGRFSQQAVGLAIGLNLVILVDVTASLHRCPEGVAGLVSTTVAGTTTSVRQASDRTPIAPAVSEFQLSGPQKQDRVRVGAIGRRVFLSDSYAGDSAELRIAWRRLFGLPPVEWLGPSPIWDAVSEVSSFLSNESGSRAIILVSDGQSTGNVHGSAEAAEIDLRSGVRVSTIAMESIISTTPPRSMASAIGKDPSDRLKYLAEKTAGQFFFDKALVAPGPSCYMLAPSPLLSKAISGLRAQ